MEDLWHLLQRRRVSFERWVEEQGYTSLGSFMTFKEASEQSKRYFISENMVQEAFKYFCTKDVLPTEEPKILESVEQVVEQQVEQVEEEEEKRVIDTKKDLSKKKTKVKEPLDVE